MACEYSFDGGKTYISKEEFIKKLAEGKLDEFIEQDVIKLANIKQPPTPPPPTEKKGEGEEEPFTKKMRSFYKSVIDRSKGINQEQKELLKADPNAFYNVLPVAESKKIALEIIEEMGVANAVLEATKKDNGLEPVERVMLLGAAMDYYAGKAKEQANKGNEEGLKEVAENEIDAQQKMLEIASELGTLGTAYGRAINIFKEIYKLSNLALERKLKNQVDKLNKVRAAEADDQAKEIKKIVTDEKAAVKDAASDLTETDLMRNIDEARKIKELEQEVAELKKQILERDNAAKGTKKNPLKIKRVTNDTEYDKRLKEFKQRQRSIISKDDITDLTYFGLYHIENGITKFKDWVKVMTKDFKGFKENLPDIYKNVRDKAVQNGADENLFDNDSELQETIDDFQKESDAKKMANATKRKAAAELSREIKNNPDKARVLAPKIAAERIRNDAAKNLDMPSTKVEQTYLQKLVNVVNQKAREYYKETKENVSNVNDILSFAIANGKSDYAIWERTQQELERQIEADNKLTEEQKTEVKEFLQEYTDSIFETLLTENQKEKIIREKLIEAGYYTEKTQNGKVTKSVDWSKVIGNSKNIQDAKTKIKDEILSLGFTEAEAKNEINAILDAFDKKVLDRKTKEINAYLNKGVINKAKSALGVGNVKKSKVQKLIDMNNKGMLNEPKIKSALAAELGLIELTDSDLAEVRRLSEIIDDENIPYFMKSQFEEQLQYLFDKKGGNIMYLENREASTNNRLSSIYNQLENATGFFRTFSTLFTVALKTQSPKKAAQVFIKEFANSMQDAKTILLKGRVSRGSSFADLTRIIEGEPRVRYTEYGNNKFLGGNFLGKTAYANIGGKKVDLNPINQAYAKVKYISRLLETVDTPSSGVISGLTQYWQISKQIDKFYPELSNKEKEQKIWDIMYNVDRNKLYDEAVEKLRRAKVDNPSKSEINRTINEIAERNRNKILSDEFYKALESDKVVEIANKRLKDRGVENPTKEDVLKESYTVLGFDQPLDVVARGERQAGRETGKSTTFGITSAILLPVDAIQKGISNKLRKNETQTGKVLANSADTAFSQLFPFVNSIGRWVEMQLELTPYGFLKGAAYKTGIARAVMGGDKTKIPKSEFNELGDDYMIRAGLGLMYNVLGMYAISLIKSLVGDEEEAEESVIGTLEAKNYTQERVQSIGKPKQSVNIGGYNLPLRVLGNSGISLGMYADFIKMRKDKEQEERGILYISAVVVMESILEATWYSSATKYGGIASDIFKGKDEKYMPQLGSIAGRIIGSNIPFNRGQVEMATLLDPQSKQGKDFGTNLLNQLSIVKSVTSGKPNFDYRGRTYDYGDIYVNSADGLVKMFSKGKYGDDIDDFLSRINFAATDAYRETKDAENYKYAIEERNGQKRFMTVDEYYDFKLETAKKFNSLIKETYKKIDRIKIYGEGGKVDNIETDKLKKEAASKLLNYSKELAIKEIQKRTKFAPNNIDEKEQDRKENIKDQKADILESILGEDYYDQEE